MTTTRPEITDHYQVVTVAQSHWDRGEWVEAGTYVVGGEYADNDCAEVSVHVLWGLDTNGDDATRYVAERIADALSHRPIELQRKDDLIVEFRKRDESATRTIKRLQVERDRFADRARRAESYPTVDAYEAVCAARTKWQDRAEKAEARIEELKEQASEGITALQGLYGVADKLGVDPKWSSGAEDLMGRIQMLGVEPLQKRAENAEARIEAALRMVNKHERTGDVPPLIAARLRNAITGEGLLDGEQ